MKAISTIFDLLQKKTLLTRYQNLLSVTYGEGGLALLNYTDLCQRLGRWDEVTSLCRGLIVDTQKKEVAAYPFPKFFNWDEKPALLPKEPFTVTEKMDGSLGVLYRYNQELRLATRGSFTSPEALRGTELLQKLPGRNKIPSAYTLLFEIILPEQGAHLVRYEEEALVLLAGFDRFTGEELSDSLLQAQAEGLGCATPKRYTFQTIEEAVVAREALPENQEGFVVRFAGGLRLKIKGTAYLKALKKALGVSRSKVLEVLLKGDAALAAFLRKAPEEMQPEISRLGEELKESAKALETEARALFAKAPSPKDKSGFLRWVEAQPAHTRAALIDLGNQKAPRWYRLLAENEGVR